ncbi:ATP-binding protein [Chromobacterium sp. S0633]|uniref:ATP-binding protein n=1 Tax=unclassified Chromobacterium TaxID=2641838 RepID=UPI001304AA4E|nr:ATP-binding protein [Chromobacterium sp. Panama]MCP1290111.1 ATP-binding protein [Chromobacterium sp. S0633]
MRFQHLSGLLVLCGVLSACADQGSKIPLSREEEAWVSRNPVVDVYVLRSKPAAKRKNSNVHYKGVEAFFLQYVSEKSGLRFNIVQVHSAQALIEASGNGRAMMLASINQDAIGELNLNKNYYFTQPYSSQPLMAITRRDYPVVFDHDNLHGRKLAFIFNDNSRSWLLGDHANPDLVAAETPTQALLAIQDRRADIGLVPESYARFLLNYRFPDLSSSGALPGYYAIYRMGVSKHQPLLYAILRRSLDTMSADDVDAARSAWEEQVAPRPSVSSVFRSYAGEGTLLVLLFFVLLLVIRTTTLLLRKARTGEAAKSEFLAVVSHEIRTPMNAIIAAGELLQTMSLGEKQRELVLQSNLAASSLLQLLNNILNASRLDAGQESLDPSFVNVGSILEDQVRLYALAAKMKGLELRYVHALPERAFWLDASHLQRVLHNLMSNAIKFTDKGTVTLKADLRRGKSSRKRGVLVCQVIDTGIGVPLAAQKNIFDAFVQADSVATRKFGGSGLGLSICKRLVELMQGRITLDSDGASGTILTIKLPVRLGPALVKEAAEEEASGPPQAVGQGQLVLVVEDHPANQLMICEQLRQLGCRATVASTGMSSLSILKEHPEVRLILMDCSLPDISGYEATRRIRAWEREEGGALLPIVAISAANDDLHRERCMDSGMNGVLVKPLRLRDLQHILLMWLPDAAPVSEAVESPPQVSGLWQMFIEHNERDYRQAVRAVQHAHWSTASQHLHRISGAALTMEQRELAELARELEGMLLQGGAEGLDERMDALRAMLDQLAAQTPPAGK